MPRECIQVEAVFVLEPSGMGGWTTMPEILANRAPFLTLWASVVARRLGYDADEALTLGRAVAGQTAAAKGKRLGILMEREAADREELRTKREDLGAEVVRFMDRSIPCLRVPEGFRALAEAAPINPRTVRCYVESKFKEELPLVERKLTALADACPPEELEARAIDLYLRMRPVAAGGESGVGADGTP